MLKSKVGRYVVVKVHSSWTDFFAYFQQQVCSLSLDILVL
jgi:hypothetical protein